MKRLRVSARLLGAVLLALGARMITDGLTPTVAVTTVLVVILLLASLGLARHGRRLEPAPSDPVGRRGRR